MTSIFTLPAGKLSLKEIHFLLKDKSTLKISEPTKALVTKSHQHLIEFLKKDRIAYGINTGFGALAHKIIPLESISLLQKKLLLSHAAGVGELLPNEVVKLILLLKINTLSQGYSGVRWEVVEALVKLYNAEVYPCIPAKGSVGASGDLSPLAHLGLCLLGEGKVRVNNIFQPAILGLEKAKITPLELGPKEGLSLINGTQVSTALAVKELFVAEKLLNVAILAGALTVHAAGGSHQPFDPRIHLLRGQIGQIVVAKKLLNLLGGNNKDTPYKASTRIQDPYCLRCQPQVLGACYDQLKYASELLNREINAVTDNPLIFSENEIISGGNFHAEPVAMAADSIALALAEIGNIAERCVAMLVDAHHSGLPAFLAKEDGLNSGFMSAQITATALASENRSLAHPAVIDNIPTGANQEDHVSMATFAAYRLGQINSNLAYILSIQFLAACQGIDLRQEPLVSSSLQYVFNIVRAKIPSYEDDRCFANDIETMAELIHTQNWEGCENGETYSQIITKSCAEIVE